jgi:hypothetical protein
LNWGPLVAWQALYNLTQASSPFCFSYFSNIISGIASHIFSLVASTEILQPKAPWVAITSNLLVEKRSC